MFKTSVNFHVRFHFLKVNILKILKKDARSDTRKIREAIHIRRDRHPKLNIQQGSELSPIYNCLLRSGENSTGNT